MDNQYQRDVISSFLNLIVEMWCLGFEHYWLYCYLKFIYDLSKQKQFYWLYHIPTGAQNVSSERPLRQFVTGKDKSAGRNSKGHITIFHRGGGAKWSQRTIDLKRNTSSVGVVERIEYDPNRTSRIAVVRWVEGAAVDRPKKVNSLQKNFTPPPRSYPPSPSKVSFHSLQFPEC